MCNGLNSAQPLPRSHSMIMLGVAITRREESWILYRNINDKQTGAVIGQ